MSFIYIELNICCQKIQELVQYYIAKISRTRQRMVNCVPQSDPNDPTRLPEIYDSTYIYLL